MGAEKKDMQKYRRPIIHEPELPHGPEAAKEVADMEDTNDFYMEVNEGLAAKITDDALLEINKLENSDADNGQLMQYHQ